MSTFNYTTGNALTFNRSDYVGYYNITNGVITTGKIHTSESLPLGVQNTALGEFISRDLKFNFNPLVDTTLPYQLSSIEFKSNEIINSNSINLRIQKLQDNYAELYKRCSILTNDIPNGYVGYVALTGSSIDSFNWVFSTPGIYNNLSAFSLPLSSIENINLCDTNINEIKNLIITANNHYFIFRYNTSYTTFQFIASANKTDNVSNIYFSNLTYTDTDNKGSIYATDAARHQIYKISIASAVNNSRVNPNNPRLIEVVGGIDSPTTVHYHNNEVFVYDRATQSIYIYNDKLTFSRKFTNKRFFKDNEPVSLAVSNEGKLYVLTRNAKVLIVDKSLLGDTQIIDLDIALSNDEFAHKIVFSKNNSNILYVNTNRNLYKLFVDRLPLTIGKFLWAKQGITDVDDLRIAILDTPENEDYLILYTKNKFILCKENNNLTSVLEKNYYKIYSTDSIMLKDDYFNNLTFNNAIFKLLYNHDLLVSFIQSRYVYEYQDQLLILKKINVLDPNELQELYVKKDANYFAGVNEAITPQVFNRILDRVINYQNTIARCITPLVLNRKYPLNEVVTF